MRMCAIFSLLRYTNFSSFLIKQYILGYLKSENFYIFISLNLTIQLFLFIIYL